MARLLALTPRPRIEELGSKKISTIQTQISETETQIKTLDNQMNELKHVYETQVSELMLQKQAKLYEITSLRNVLSPIGRLAVELLAVIFEDICLSEDSVDNEEHDVMRSVFMISGVSTGWRKVIRETPKVWSKLHVSSRKHLKLIEGKSREWAKEWLEHAQGYPLDVKLELSVSRGGDNQTHALIDTIMNFRHQIRSLQLRGSDSGMYLSIFQLPSSSFPLLEKLTIIFLDMFSPLFDAMTITSRAFLGSPNLRDLEIVDYWPNASVLELVDIPVEQLTSLDIAAMDPEHDLDVYVDMLRRCKNLAKLAYCIPFPDQSSVGFTRNLSITLPALKSLDITCYIPPIVSPLACFTTPVLEDLTLQWQGQDYHSLYMDIVGLRNRSTTALEMIAILSILPELTSFSIDGCTTGLNPLVRAITYTKGQERVLLPKLTRFGFLPFETQEYPEEMTTMILSRWWLDKDKGKHKGLTRLEKVVLPGSLFEEDVSVRISRLPGLDVEYNWDL
ncbi:hypothetical protein BT96DRAFT_979630 [Gymnopus androsaceus JB14]|uniref:F-box domain-containing protein n=1 Tax=Gymnopus androsaceus JB14 TaxID=1447944 RepID=A0A6A4H2P2_9AGAR|nr:hypothetical protein BT96DRAFT_979630 [Gymnopus androsaceus JB14]